MHEINTTLDYAKLFLINERVIEVFIKSGTEVNVEKMNEMNAIFSQIFENKDYGLLINRSKTRYSHTSESIHLISTLEKQKASAILVCTALAQKAAKVHQIIPGQGPIEIFNDREEAISWLNKTLSS